MQTIGIGGYGSIAGGVVQSLASRVDDGDFLLQLDGDRDRRGAGRNTQITLADAVLDGRRGIREAAQFGVVTVEEEIVVTRRHIKKSYSVGLQIDLSRMNGL